MSVWRQLISNLGFPPVHAVRPGRAHTEVWQQAAYGTYPLLAAPVYCRPAGPLAALNGRVPERTVLRGLRVVTDEAQREGSLLELEVFAGSEPIQLVARVQAAHELPPDAPARYDVALQVCDIDPQALGPLQAVLASR